MKGREHAHVSDPAFAIVSAMPRAHCTVAAIPVLDRPSELRLVLCPEAVARRFATIRGLVYTVKVIDVPVCAVDTVIVACVVVTEIDCSDTLVLVIRRERDPRKWVAFVLVAKIRLSGTRVGHSAGEVALCAGCLRRVVNSDICESVTVGGVCTASRTVCAVDWLSPNCGDSLSFEAVTFERGGLVCARIIHVGWQNVDAYEPEVRVEEWVARSGTTGWASVTSTFDVSKYFGDVSVRAIGPLIRVFVALPIDGSVAGGSRGQDSRVSHRGSR